MRSSKFLLIVTATISLLALGACSNGTQTSSTPSPAQTTTAMKPSEAASSSPSSMTTKPDSAKGESGNKAKHGGQVVESGAYHLELVAGKGEGSTHLDFFVQKGDNHEAIADAKVTAQVQFPDGTQKSLDLAYEASEKNYTVKFDSKAAGEYKVAILTDIKGEKVNGRFSFKQ